MTETISQQEKTELEAGYAHDQRRYADEQAPVLRPWELRKPIYRYDTKGNYSHTEDRPDPFQLK